MAGHSVGVSYWQVDAFTNELFRGNPAGVFVIRGEPFTNEKMQLLAKEVNMPVSAFLCIGGDIGDDSLPTMCWFTPKSELDLCGHGSVAASHIFFTELCSGSNVFTFSTRKSGNITVTLDNKLYKIQFPLNMLTQVDVDSLGEVALLAVNPGTMPRSAFRSNDHLLLVYDNDDLVSSAVIKNALLSNSDESNISYHMPFHCQ